MRKETQMEVDILEIKNIISKLKIYRHCTRKENEL